MKSVETFLPQNSDDITHVTAVHAHPDDETLFTGATLAAYAAKGATVSLVTLTLGEASELHGATDVTAEAIHRAGQQRLAKLRQACTALGIEYHQRLGGNGYWIDAGRSGDISVGNSLATADDSLLVEKLAAIFTVEKPQVIITVGPDGVTQHPDHIMAYRITRESCRQAFGNSLETRRPMLLGACVRERDVTQAHNVLAAHGLPIPIGSGGVHGISEIMAQAAISVYGQGKNKQAALDNYMPGMGTKPLAEVIPTLSKPGDTLLLRAVAECSPGGWNEELFFLVDY